MSNELPASSARPAAPAPDPQDERDALQRAAFWRSRGECHAALLAWLIADDGAAAPWAVWKEFAGQQAFVERLRADWLALGSTSRWQVFDALAARTRDTSATDRATLIRAARSLAPQGRARLRLMLLRRALRAAPPRRGRPALEDLLPAFAAATALLAQTMGARGAAWAAMVQTPPAGAPSPIRPWHAFPLRRLHLMQGPRVARTWADAAARSGLLEDAEATQCLVAACRLLDTPAPQALLHRQPRHS